MFNVGFFGKNSLNWWIGQVPGAQGKNKLDPGKWGDRVKVRIMGYHPSEGTLLKDDDLPWAMILKPTSQGNGNRGSTSIVGGEWVMGIFLDEECQYPVILGVLGRSNPTVGLSVAQQIQQEGTGFGSVNPFVQPYNTAANFNIASGNDGTPSGSQQPLVPSKDNFKV